MAKQHGFQGMGNSTNHMQTFRLKVTPRVGWLKWCKGRVVPQTLVFALLWLPNITVYLRVELQTTGRSQVARR